MAKHVDEKRFLRNLKRDIKKAGNRKRRRHLKDLEADPVDFDFGRDQSSLMNEPSKDRKRGRDESALEETDNRFPPS